MAAHGPHFGQPRSTPMLTAKQGCTVVLMLMAESLQTHNVKGDVKQVYA